MDVNGILLLRGEEVRELLEGREADVLGAVERAYRTHGTGDSDLPHSTFLRFPHDPSARIICLPAFLGGGRRVAGMKWIASFPRNLQAGMERASATLVLNDADTGRPLAFMEASLISARRTAASAALAAVHLHEGLDHSRVGIVGCGPISLEIVRYLHAALPGIEQLVVFDLSRERAEGFRTVVEREVGIDDVRIAGSTDEVLSSTSLTAFGTTAATPHVHALPAGPVPRTILHISLRDLSADVILSADNVVDDVDHVTRASTSIHLAEQATGSRGFVRCTLADVLDGRAPGRAGDVSVFSPFGLGVLDLAVAQLAYEAALEQGVGGTLDDFFPAPWDAPRQALAGAS